MTYSLTLLGFCNRKGSTLLGIFKSINDIKIYIESGNGKRSWDDIGYVESDISGITINNVEDCVDLGLEYIDCNGLVSELVK